MGLATKVFRTRFTSTSFDYWVEQATLGYLPKALRADKFTTTGAFFLTALGLPI